MLWEGSTQIESIIIDIDKPTVLHPKISHRFTGVQSVTTRCLFCCFTRKTHPYLLDETVAELSAFFLQLPNLSDVYLYGIREHRSQPGGAVYEITAKSPYDFRTIVASSGMPQGARPVMNEMGSTFMRELVRTVGQLYSTDAIPATTTFHGLLDHQICSTAFIAKHPVPRNIACAHCERVCLDFPVEQLKNSLVCERHTTRYHNDPDERTICLPPNLALNLVAAGKVGDGDREGIRREALVDAKFFLQSIVNGRLDLAEAIVDHDLLPERITRHEIEEVFGESKPAIAEPLLLCLFEKGVPFRGADFSSVITETRPVNDFDDDDETSETHRVHYTVPRTGGV